MKNSFILDTAVKKIPLQEQKHINNMSYISDSLKKCSLGNLVCIFNSTSLKNTNTINHFEKSLKDSSDALISTIKVSAANCMKDGRIYSKLFTLDLLSNTRITPYTSKNLYRVPTVVLQTSVVTALISREIRYVFITDIQKTFELCSDKRQLSYLLHLCKHLAQSAGIIFVFEFNNYSQHKQGDKK